MKILEYQVLKILLPLLFVFPIMPFQRNLQNWKADGSDADGGVFVYGQWDRGEELSFEESWLWDKAILSNKSSVSSS